MEHSRRSTVRNKRWTTFNSETTVKETATKKQHINEKETDNEATNTTNQPTIPLFISH